MGEFEAVLVAGTAWGMMGDGKKMEARGCEGETFFGGVVQRSRQVDLKV